jgi:hypothetical protein
MVSLATEVTASCRVAFLGCVALSKAVEACQNRLQDIPAVVQWSTQEDRAIFIEVVAFLADVTERRWLRWLFLVRLGIADFGG